MDLLQILMLLIILLDTGRSQLCPMDWVEDERSDNCYLFVYGDANKKSVKDAGEACLARQGHLLKVDNTNELNWLLGQLRQLEESYEGDHAWWTGLNNNDNVMEWKWADGSLLKPDIIMWGQGEPNNYGEMERCAEIWDFHFNDKTCSTLLNYICERPNNKPLTCDVDRGWVNLHEYCYKYHDQMENWREAKFICEQEDASLAVVRTSATQKALIGYDKELMDMWIGLHSVPSGAKNFIWQWTDGSDLVNNNAAFWDNTSRSHVTPDTNKCVQMLSAPTEPVSNWQSDDCFQNKPFLCQKPQGVCPPGTIQYQVSCYQIVSSKLSWNMASDDCKLKGASLLGINSEKEQKFINSMLRQIFQSGISTIWLGISDDKKDSGLWFWTTGDALGSYLNWAEPEVQNTIGVQDCAFVYTDDLEGRWIPSIICSRPHSYICESVPGSIPPVFPTDASAYECESGWELYESSCLLFTDQVSNWDDARTSCQSYEADLIQVDDFEENEFIFSRLPGNSWIGLNDRKTEGVFVWLDSTEQPDFFYSNWNSGEPNNLNNEDCVMFLAEWGEVKKKWNDEDCGRMLTFVCEKSASLIVSDAIQEPRVTTTKSAPVVRFTKKIPQQKAITEKEPMIVKTTTTARTTTRAYVNAKCGQFWEEDPNTDFCYLLRDEELTWMEALQSCHNHDGKLISINNIQEQFFISGLIRGRAVRSLTLWVGANDRSSEGGWSWIDQSPMAFIYWASGEPSTDMTGEEDCAAMFVRETTWGSFPCNIKAGYICKKFVGLTTTTQKPVPPTFPDGMYYGCAAGYEEYRSACFMVVREKKTWLEARSYCRQQGDDLASIADEEEQNFIYSLLPEEVCYNMFHDDSSCTKWSESGECQKNPLWMAKHCHHSCSYCIRNCQDVHNTEQCRHWASIGECFKNSKWMLSNCPLSCGICDSAIYGGFWIGLNDLIMPMSYMWSDGVGITYTNWARNEPEAFAQHKQNCVSLYLQNGHWNDRICEEKLPGFICRQTKSVLPLASTADPQVSQGCYNGSVAYDASCYLFVDEGKNWDEADDICIQNGGHLATIHDRFIQSFLASQLYSKTGNYWIGLSGNTSFHWLDGSEVSFTHWARNYPISEKGDCAAMVIGQSFGFWKTMSCLDEGPFICESPRNGITRNPAETTTTMMLAPCLDDWKEYEGYCYKLFRSVETWITARENCRNLGGDHASAHNKETVLFLVALIRVFSLNTVWVGLNDRDSEEGFVWSDGSPTDYISWTPGNPDDHMNNEDCVELYAPRASFNDLNCYRANEYVCKVKKGMFIAATDATNATTEVSESCEQKGWLYYDNYCYFFSLQDNLHKTWFEAQEYCQEVGSNLVSIHGQNENNFLLSKFSKMKRSPSWIGLNELDLDGYRWSDSTQLDFLSWNGNEPNQNYGAEKCIGIFADSGMWLDNHCSVKYGFICKRLNGSSTTQVPTTTATVSGGCLENFHQIGNKCFYVGGDGEQEKLSWVSAQKACRQFGKGYHIASISSSLEQAFVTSMMHNVTSDIWIGLNSLRPNKKFIWQDNTRLLFTNWQSGQSSVNPQLNHFGFWRNMPVPLKRSCVAMMFVPGSEIGLWAVFLCGDEKSFLCQGPTIQAIPAATPASGPCSAPYLYYRTSCYGFYLQPQNWTEALAVCQSSGASLISITDIFEDSYIRVFTANKDQLFWIGLNKLKNGKIFKWTDNLPVQFTNWAANQPAPSDDRQCVKYENGSWNALACSQSYPFICKKSTSDVPVTTLQPTQSSGYCFNKYWKMFGDFCYYISVKDSQAWSNANQICSLMGMELASLHSQSETKFIMQEIEKLLPVDMTESFKKYGIKLWIGLRIGASGIYQWTDKSAVAYFDWHDGEPREIINHGDCVEMTGITGQWSSIICTAKRGYVCKAAKVTPSTSFSVTTTKMKIPGMLIPNYNPKISSNPAGIPHAQPVRQEKTAESLSPGQIIVIVIGVVGAVVMVTCIVFVVRHIRSSATYTRTPQGFDNALYTSRNQSVFMKDNFDNPSISSS